MNTYKNKVLLPLIMILVCIFSLSDSSAVTVKATAPDDFVIDQAGLLSTEEEQKLEETCKEQSAIHNTSICIVTTNNFGGGDIKDWQRSYFSSHKMGTGSQGNGIMLAISMADRDWGIVGFGNTKSAFTQYGRERIANIILDDLSDGNYYDAFDTYVSLCDDFLTEAADGKPYDSSHKYKENVPIFIIIPGSFAIALIISLIIVLGWKRAMNTRILQSGASEYLDDGSFHLTNKRDTFLYFTVSRTRRESKSSSGSIDSDSSGSSGKF